MPFLAIILVFGIILGSFWLEIIKIRVLGQTSLSKKKKGLHIHLMMVAENYKRAGVGSAMILKISTNCSTTITVKTFTYLRNTINFYIKNKFQVLESNQKTTLLERK